MTLGSVFTNNRTQAVRLPAEVRFPDTVSKVTVRVVGKERILAPLENTWDSFFCAENEVSDDDKDYEVILKRLTKLEKVG